MPYKLASLLLSSEQKSSSIAKIAWAEADQGDPANEVRFSRVGKIFSLVEVYATNAKALLLLDFFSERPKLNYYQQPDLDKNEHPGLDDLEKFFTAAIQQTNHDLAAFLAEHKISYLEPEVSATIGLLTERGLFLTSIGRNQAWMLLPGQDSGKQVVKMITPAEDGAERTGRLFSEIFSGALPNGDYCLISNEALAEYIEPSTAMNLLANKSPLVGAEKLRHFLQQTNRRVDFLGLIIKRCHRDERDDEACLEMPAGLVSNNQSTTVATPLMGNNLRLTEERTEKILNPSGWAKFVLLLKKVVIAAWQWLIRFSHRDWVKVWRNNYQDGREYYQETKEKIRAWRGWPIIGRYGRRLLLIGQSAWYKAQPRLRQVNNRWTAYWFKTAPWRCRLVEKYWLPLERVIQPLINFFQAISRRVHYFLDKGYQQPRTYWQRLTKRSRIFLGLASACLLLLIIGMFWQYRSQIRQANWRQKTDQVALVEQKHNQIEANLLYNNLTSANQSLDEAAALLEQWQAAKEKLPAEITERWQNSLLKQEKLLGQVRHIYTLRNGQALADQPITAVTSTDSLLRLNGQLLAWTDSASRQVIYQNSRQEWQTVAWPEGWQTIVAAAADGQSWYFAAGDGQIASLSRDGQWKVWPLDKPISQIKALAFYGGRIYIVAGDNQIYRYQKQADNFNSGQQWNTDQLPAGDIAGLAVDGQAYVFYQDGRAFKFNNGRRQAIAIKAVEPVAVGWSNCQLLTDSDNFYCLESGYRRILLYGQDGAISGQYRLADRQAQAAAISSVSKAIYLLTDQAIQKFVLPAE